MLKAKQGTSNLRFSLPPFGVKISSIRCQLHLPYSPFSQGQSKRNETEQQKRKPYSQCIAVTPPAIIFLRVQILRHLPFYSQHFTLCQEQPLCCIERGASYLLFICFHMLNFKSFFFLNSVTGFDKTKSFRSGETIDVCKRCLLLPLLCLDFSFVIFTQNTTFLDCHSPGRRAKPRFCKHQEPRGHRLR